MDRFCEIKLKWEKQRGVCIVLFRCTTERWTRTIFVLYAAMIPRITFVNNVSLLAMLAVPEAVTGVHLLITVRIVQSICAAIVWERRHVTTVTAFITARDAL